MKKSLIAILFIFLGFSGFAQKQKVNFLTTFDDKLIHFGFTIGINALDFNVVNYPDFVSAGITAADLPQDNSGSSVLIPMRNGGEPFVYSDVATIVPGFTVGIISSLRLTKDLNLRFLPGLSFGERQLTYNIPVYDINSYETSSYYYSIKSTFLDFPLLIKYKARRINNDRPYVIFGGAYRHDISRTAQEDLIKLKGGGFYAEIGGGWDHYFAFFRFSVEAKFSYGLNNQLGDLPGGIQSPLYAKSIQDLRSKIFTLSFHFE